MEKLLIFLLLLFPIILISGCSTQVQTTGKLTEQVSIEEEVTEEVTKGITPTVQPKVEEKVETEVREPKTFQVNIVENVGIKEGAG